MKFNIKMIFFTHFVKFKDLVMEWLKKISTNDES